MTLLLKLFFIPTTLIVRSRLGPRQLQNPLGFAKFDYTSIDEAEKAIGAAASEVEMDDGEAAANAFENLAVSSTNEVSGGAAGKFKKKDKKKKKKPKF